MAQWRVVYRGRAAELVDADDYRRESTHVVLVAWGCRVMQARAVMVRRLAAANVERVERVG